MKRWWRTCSKRIAKWYDSHTRVFQLWYHGEWGLGQDHIWYDGSHCQFALGPFRVQWSNPSCKKCSGE